jgi:four helix bundle protein
LNLAEGSGKSTQKERRRFFVMAYASTKEVQACIDLEGLDLQELADNLGGSIYRLIQKLS